MSRAGGQGGPYADDEFGRDGDFVYPSDRAQGWQPGWDLGRGADRADRQGGGYGPDYNGADYNGNGAYGGGYGSDGYGSGGYGGNYDSGRYSAGGYGSDSYEQDAYGRDQYGGPEHGQAGGYGSQSADGYDQNGYSQGGYAHGEFGSGPDSYGRDLYAQEGYRQGQNGPPDQYGYRPDTGSFAPDDSSWFSRPDTGSFGRPDTGSFGRPDTGSFGRPDTGSFGRPDTGSFGRPDTGSFGRPDTGSFGRPDAAPPGQPDDYSRGDEHYGAQSGYDQFSSEAYPPDRYQPDQYPSDEAEDAGDWDDARQDRPAWEDDASGLLSRRFGGDQDVGDGRRRQGRRAGRAKRQRRARGKVAFTTSIVAVAVVVVAAGIYGFTRYEAWHTTRYGDYSGAGTGTVDVTVTPGTSLAQLGPALMHEGVIKEIRPFTSAADAARNSADLQPGVYQLHRHMSSALAVSYLLNTAHRIKDQVTIIEGMRASKIASVLSAQTKIPVAQFTQIIERPPASLGLPSWAPKNATAEGFLFPDTYTLLPHMTALAVLQAMVREFNEKVAQVNLVGAAKAVFTTPWHALIVASMIQAEAGNKSDFAKISRVTWNRLKDNMPLQYDSTVFYALNQYGTAATSQEQKVKSPYNTYAHTGLPPGPISSPGVLALQAAVHPVKGDLLYFITDTRKKPYRTHFTDSFAQFEQWKQEFEG